MAKKTPSDAQKKRQADAVEQLELAQQVLEKAKANVEEAQNVLEDTKEALGEQGSAATPTT